MRKRKKERRRRNGMEEYIHTNQGMVHGVYVAHETAHTTTPAEKGFHK